MSNPPNDYCHDPERAYWSDPDPWLEAHLHELETHRQQQADQHTEAHREDENMDL